MKWEEIEMRKALTEGGCVPATIHYHNDKQVWLKPIDESASAGEDAVEFAEWIDEEGYKSKYSKPKAYTWTRFPENKEFTTQQLYKLFRESKNQDK